jgi:hypothetical protein
VSEITYRFGRKPYFLKEENYVIVCAWCYPGQTIKKLYPEIAGRDISHTICPYHTKQLEKELPPEKSNGPAGLLTTGPLDPETTIIPKQVGVEHQLKPESNPTCNGVGAVVEETRR